MLKNRCVRCDHVIEAPDERRGQVVVCPGCEATNVLRGAEDEAVDAERERAEFLRRLADPASPGGAGQAAGQRPSLGAADPWRAPVEATHASELVLLAGRRLKDIADYLLLFAYGLVGLAVLSGGVVALWGGLSPGWAAFAFGAGAFAGVLAFVTFKFMSDAARALADLGGLGRSVDARLDRLEDQLRSLDEDRASGRRSAAPPSDG